MCETMYMRASAEVWPEADLVQPPVGQLLWGGQLVSRSYMFVPRTGQVSRSLHFFNREAVLAVGLRVRSLRGTQFRPDIRASERAPSCLAHPVCRGQIEVLWVRKRFASTTPQGWSGYFDGDAQLEPGRIDLGLERVLDPNDRMVAEGLRPARCELRGVLRSQARDRADSGWYARSIALAGGLRVVVVAPATH
jgi:hypothetical protein